MGTETQFEQCRLRMVRDQLQSRKITDPAVLLAMSTVPRHEFVPKELRRYAYEDRPLPIGSGQTISQPYIVALMTQLARVTEQSRVLDVGTGCGYQAAVLGQIVREVFSVEIVDNLATEASARLNSLGYNNVHVQHSDGRCGWPEEAPFDAIIAAAAPIAIPKPLIEQLAAGGRLVIPVGVRRQSLTVVDKQEDGAITTETVLPVAFVPMTGKDVADTDLS